MLVLSRRRDEEIVISIPRDALKALVQDNRDLRIEVKVTRIGQNDVRLGFMAPKECSIFRSEVQDRIDRKETA
jgi:carbon storage regulator CsrA